MKRLNHLWDRLVSFDNLWLAWRKARKGKARSSEIAIFELNLESNLLNIQNKLESSLYVPGDYRLFTIYERKRRVIAAAPFRDRVVHHALMNLIEPPLDRGFIYDSYACRKGKGVHKAVDRYQHWARRLRYVLKLDIQQYFPSIDHDILKLKLRNRIKDKQVLALLDLIIDASPAPAPGQLCYFPGDDLLTPLERRSGIPIGNLTSQFFANLFLDDFDHWVKHTLKAKAFLRYVDDMALLGNDKSRLSEWREAIREKLAEQRLKLHPNKAHIYPTRDGLNLLGYVVFPGYRRLRSDNGHRFRRRLKEFACAYRAGYMKWDDFNPSVQSWIGHASHADTQGLRQRIFSEVSFIRGIGRG